MVTKKTRWLSAIAAVIMLVSMLAVIVVPAGAASGSAILNALQKKYAAFQQEHFVAEVDRYSVEDARNKIAELIEGYNKAPEYNYGIYEEMGEEYDRLFVAANNGNLKSDLIVRYSFKEEYEEMGYNPDASTYYISDVEDWNAAAASGSIFLNKTLLVTNDIDFQGQTVEPLTANETAFMGVLDGQGHRFINMVIDIDGDETSPKRIYKYGGLVAALTGGTIKNLGLEGGEVNFNGEDTVTDRNEGVGSFAGYIGEGGLLQNCWSTMTVTNKGELIEDGKNGVAGLVGWGGGGAIDNCFFAGTVNNTGSSRAAADLIGYTANSVKVYNSIGAGTLNCGEKRNPAAVGVHYTMYTEIERFSIFNTYGVGKNAIRHRGNYDPYSFKDKDDAGNTIYVNYVKIPDTDITFTKDIVHKFTPEETNAAYMVNSLEEAVWAVNRRFDTTHQTERDYIISVDENGKLYMAKKEDAKIYRKVTIEGSVSGVYYFKEGAKIHLRDDLGLLDAESVTIEQKEFTSALKDYELTVPAGDIVINIEYTYDSELEVHVAELKNKVEKYENLNFGLFNCDATLSAWVPAAKTELEKTEKDLDMIKTLLEMEKEFSAEMALRPGAYPSVTEYEIHREINTGKEWAINSVDDWLALIELSKTNTFEGETFHVLKDIDFGKKPMAPLSYVEGQFGDDSTILSFKGTIEGHGNAFLNVNVFVGPSDPSNPKNTAAGLIGKLGAGAVIRNFGVESGSIEVNCKNYDQASTFGEMVGAATLTKVWSGADIIANAHTESSFASGSHGIVAHSQDSGGIINGAYFYGTLITTGTRENNRAMAIAGDNMTGMSVFNTLGAPIVSDSIPNSKAQAGIRYKSKDGTYFANNYGVGIPGDYINIDNENSDDRVASVEEGAYKINQNSIGLKGAKGEALQPIYFTMKDGKVVFGADDGSDQIRKITFENKGVYISEMYAVAGTTVSLVCEKALTIDSISVGEKSTFHKEIATLELGNEDVTIEVTVDASVALEARIAAVQQLLEKYDFLSPDKFTEGEKITAWKTAAVKAIEDNDSDALYELINQEKVMAEGLALKEDFWPAFTQYETYKDFNRENNWLIASKADWDAMNEYALASTTPNEYFKGFTFHLEEDVDFEKAEMKPLGPQYGKVFSGTIDGHGFGFKNVSISVKGSDVKVNDAGTGYFEGKDMNGSVGLIAYLGNCEIRDFGIHSGTINAGTSNGSGSVSTFGTIPENTIETAPTFTRVWSGATLEGVTNAHVNGLAGFLNAKSSAVKVNGFIFTGTMKKKGTYAAAQRNTAFGVMGNSGGACVDMGEFYNIITKPTIETKNIKASFIFGFSSEAAFKTAMETNKVKNVYGLGGINDTYRIGASGVSAGETTFGKVDYNLIKKEYSVEELAWNANQNSYNPTGEAEDAVYFTVKNNKVAFGKVDGSDQIGRVVVKNGDKIVKTIYANFGSEVDLGALDAQLYQLPEDAKSQINGATLTVGDKDVVVKVVACSHENAKYSHIANTMTHIVQCNDCGGVLIADCELSSWIANDDLVIDGDKVTGTHSASCIKCSGDEQIGNCEGTLVFDKNDCTQSYFTFDCCTREDINAGKEHIYKNENWTTQGAPSGQEVNQCVNCETKQYRPERGQLSISAENEAVPGASVNLTVTLPALKSATIKIAPVKDTSAEYGYTSKYEITSVEDGDINGTLKDGIYTAILSNMQVEEGTEIKVNVSIDKAEFVEGMLKVEITDAENAEGRISDATATATIAYEGKEGDADVSGKVNIMDALAVLQQCVDSSNTVHIANADVWKKDGIGIINTQDALEIIRIWALTLSRKD